MEKGDGQIGVDIKVASKKELSGFKNMFYSRAATGLGEEHLWLSVLTKPPHNTFTRAQRLSACLSLFFAAMVTNAMFYQTGASPVDTFQVGPITISLNQIKIGIQSGLIALPVNVLVVSIFKSVKPAKSAIDAKEAASTYRSEKKTPGCLPHFVVYFGWILSILTILTSSAFVFFYSLMWGAETSNEWLVSIMVSFVQDVWIMQPIKVVLLASLLSLLVKKPSEQDADQAQSPLKTTSNNNTNEALNDSNGGDIEAASGSLPNQEELRRARQYRIQFTEMVRALVEIAFFLFFALLLMVVCYSNRNVMRFMLTQSTHDILIRFEKVFPRLTYVLSSKDNATNL